MEIKTTFTVQVKEEICSLEYTDEQLLSLLAGFVKVNGSLTLTNAGFGLSLQNENSKIIKLIYNAFKRLFNVTPAFSYTKKMKLDKGVVYGLRINERASEILEKLELMNDGMFSFPSNIVLEDKLRFFITGAFLASGSVNSPSSKNYHLQMVVSQEDDGKYFLKLLNRFRNEKEMNFKMIAKGNKFVLYLKRADQIGVFLNITQAYQSFFDFENVRIEKDFINSDNRIQVCYNANYQKSLQKGEEQCKEINRIKERGLFYSLSEKEQLVANLRLANPDAPLTALASILLQEHNIVLSKSGVNHILKKIHDKYLESLYD